MTERKPTEDAAVALKYDQRHAPQVTASGQGTLAQEILALARQHNVPIYENAELVDILARLDLGDEVPETLYRIIAEILAFAFHLQGRVPEGFEHGPDSSER